MAKILSFPTKINIKTSKKSTRDSYDEVEKKWGVIIEKLLEEIRKNIEEKLGRTMLDNEFWHYIFHLHIEIEQILQWINIPPEEEDYIESTEFKVAVFKQKIEEWRFREKLLWVFGEM